MDLLLCPGRMTVMNLGSASEGGTRGGGQTANQTSISRRVMQCEEPTPVLDAHGAHVTTVQHYLMVGHRPCVAGRPTRGPNPAQDVSILEL